MDLDINAYREMQNWFKKTDPLHEREAEFFNTLSYIDLQNIVHRIKGKVLMVTGLMDEICHNPALCAMRRKERRRIQGSCCAFQGDEY